jgi:hypothetical protein
MHDHGPVSIRAFSRCYSSGGNGLPDLDSKLDHVCLRNRVGAGGIDAPERRSMTTTHTGIFRAVYAAA